MMTFLITIHGKYSAMPQKYQIPQKISKSQIFREDRAQKVFRVVLVSYFKRLTWKKKFWRFIIMLIFISRYFLKIIFEWSGSPTPGCSPKGNEDLRSHNNPHMRVYSPSIFNRQDLEINQVSFRRWMVKHVVVRPHCRILLRSLKKQTVHTTTLTILKDSCAERKRAGFKRPHAV